MTEKEMKKWLKRAFYADKKIKALEMLVNQCRERAEGLAVCYECNDAGKSTGSENGTENALVKLADMERKAEIQKAAAVGISSEVQNAISLLADEDLESVLIHRYILFHTIEETAEIMNYSPRTVREKQKKAVQKLCLLMPCFSY